LLNDGVSENLQINVLKVYVAAYLNSLH